MADKEKKPIQQLRDLHGGISEELKAHFKELNRARKLLKQALKAGPKTIPELARETGLEAPATMWHVMAMKKYGAVVEGDLRGDYYAYVLAEE
jgi:hypothetical protein